MNVQRAMTACIQQSRREQQSIGGDHDCIRAQSAYLLDLRRAFQAMRLQHGDAVCAREALHGAARRAQAPARGAVRLRQNQRNLVAGGYKARKSSLSELGRAGKD